MAANLSEMRTLLLSFSALLHELGWATVALAISDGDRILIQKLDGIKEEALVGIFGPEGGETIQ